MPKKLNNFWWLVLILIAGFVARIVLVNKVIVGDELTFFEWGQKFWEWGPAGYYFGNHTWFYSYPNYPPVIMWIFAGLSWLFQHRYWLAQMHNIVRFPPAFFIVYFYKYGELLLYKLLPILSDLGLGVIIYKLVVKLTGKKPRALMAAAFFVLNPLTVFLSGAWGQIDSLVALLGMSAFLLMVNKKIAWSMIFFFLAMYIKPTWGLLVPFYLYLLYLQKPVLKKLITGVLIVLSLLAVVSLPFADGNLIKFTQKIWYDRYFVPIKYSGRASSSAFDFMTIFLKIDRDPYNAKVLGIIPADLLGLIFYIILNILACKFLKKSKDKLWGTLVGIFIVGTGGFLFMSNMLERYFFAGFVPMIIVMFVDIKTFFYGLIINLIFMANLLWSFYRRGSDEIDHPFTNNNFLLIKILSVIVVAAFSKFYLAVRRVKI
jgi:Gpi18-like mannosyltransferase